MHLNYIYTNKIKFSGIKEMNILSKFTTITWNDPLEFICSNYIQNKQIIRYILNWSTDH